MFKEKGREGIMRCIKRFALTAGSLPSAVVIPEIGFARYVGRIFPI